MLDAEQYYYNAMSSKNIARFMHSLSLMSFVRSGSGFQELTIQMIWSISVWNT
jgi:hypothetical protein